MPRVIIGFSTKERIDAVREIIAANGFADVACCQSGEEVLRAAAGSAGGIVICGLKIGRMRYMEVYEALPMEFGMLLLVSGRQLDFIEEEEVFTLVLPVGKADLVRTVRMVLEIGQKHVPFHPGVFRDRDSQKGRSEAEKRIIERAKLFLMNKYRISERAAHRFIQKNSMDSGRKMEETAAILLEEDSFFTK